MNKFLSYIGGLVGSLSLAHLSLAGSILSGLGSVISFIALLGTVVFSAALMWDGVKTLIKR